MTESILITTAENTANFEQNNDRKAKVCRFGKRAMQALAIATGGLFTSTLALQATDDRQEINGLEVAISLVPESETTLTMNSSLGSVAYDGISKLPIGIEITPAVSDINSLTTATQDMPEYLDALENEAREAIPGVIRHFAITGALGLAVGSAGTMLAYKGMETLAGRRREDDWKPSKALATGIATALITTGSVGLASYDKNWQNTWEVTGALGQLFETPDQLEKLSQMDIAAGQKQLAAIDALREIVSNSPETNETEPASLNILLISDMHLRNGYAQLKQLIDKKDIDLIINTGDETEFGSGFDLTVAPSYLESIREITKDTPMIWVKGNHDSPQVAEQMSQIKGVHVLDKQTIDAYGLKIAGMGDPRNYTDGGDVSSSHVANLEKDYASEIVPLLQQNDPDIDMFITHHPAASEQAREILDNNSLITVDGHMHNQSVEYKSDKNNLSIHTGSTGSGGLKGIGIENDNQKIEFGVLEISDNCSALKLTQYSLSDQTIPNRSTGAASITQTQIEPYETDESRTCDPDLGLGEPVDWGDYASK